jgi:tetratricopeptide (TPR) repeat protein
MVAYSLGDFAKAMRLYKDSERIWRELDDKNGLQTCLGNQSALLNAMDRTAESLNASREQERLCRELGADIGLHQSLGNQAVILRSMGQFGEAQRLLEEQEEICRRLHFDQGLAYSLVNQALLWANERGKPQKGLALAEEGYEIACKNNLVQVANGLRPYLDEIRAKVHEPSRRVYIPPPHPGANAELAGQRNVEYQKELARWDSLPWLKRIRTKKPQPPEGI